MFAAFFILILAFNWSGLIPIVGRVEVLRAPTSDVNVTIGLALVAFFIFHIEGFRRLGFKGYAGKFFPFYEFKNGIGAGLIALFVGLVELMLEFVKPLTLSMRLFGNIYGGEVALGVVTALTVAVLPVALYGLEIMLTFVQALIFSTLDAHVHHRWPSRCHHHEEGELGARGHGGRAATPTHPHTRSGPLAARPPTATGTGRSPASTQGGTLRTWNTSAPASPPWASSAPASASASWVAWRPRAIGRNPDAASQIRGLAIILAAFAEGLGVLAVVVGLLAIFIQPA